MRRQHQICFQVLIRTVLQREVVRNLPFEHSQTIQLIREEYGSRAADDIFNQNPVFAVRGSQQLFSMLIAQELGCILQEIPAGFHFVNTLLQFD